MTHSRSQPSTEHREIWLEPSCAAEGGGDRSWCQDDVWGACDECGTKSVKYIIATEFEALEKAWRDREEIGNEAGQALVNSLRAELASARKALEKCQKALAAITDPKAIKTTSVINAFAQATEAECEARAALGQPK